MHQNQLESSKIAMGMLGQTRENTGSEVVCLPVAGIPRETCSRFEQNISLYLNNDKRARIGSLKENWKNRWSVARRLLVLRSI
jgi:uncharacterized protein (UPF0254 family)